ncbi:MAG TPA: hypothetical protein VHB99_11555, partial [Pirellulales bacterium]|nr:hypothetical protein [Pirellulales bacterium]
IKERIFLHAKKTLEAAVRLPHRDVDADRDPDFSESPKRTPETARAAVALDPQKRSTPPDHHQVSNRLQVIAR